MLLYNEQNRGAESTRVHDRSVGEIFLFWGKFSSLLLEGTFPIANSGGNFPSVGQFFYFNGRFCTSAANTDDQSGYLINVLKSLQKHIDINDGKLANFLYKYYSIKKSYDRLWKLFLKQIEEKSSSQQQQENDQKLLQINSFFLF